MHPIPDPYTNLLDRLGNSCCHGTDCRPAIIKDINLPGDPNDGKLAVGIMFSNNVHFYIGDPKHERYSENSPEKLISNNTEYISASDEHACIVGDEVRCTVRPGKV